MEDRGRRTGLPTCSPVSFHSSSHQITVARISPEKVRSVDRTCPASNDGDTVTCRDEDLRQLCSDLARARDDVSHIHPSIL